MEVWLPSASVGFEGNMGWVLAFSLLEMFPVGVAYPQDKRLCSASVGLEIVEVLKGTVAGFWRAFCLRVMACYHFKPRIH